MKPKKWGVQPVIPKGLKSFHNTRIPKRSSSYSVSFCIFTSWSVIVRLTKWKHQVISAYRKKHNMGFNKVLLLWIKRFLVKFSSNKIEQTLQFILVWMAGIVAVKSLQRTELTNYVFTFTLFQNSRPIHTTTIYICEYCNRTCICVIKFWTLSDSYTNTHNFLTLFMIWPVALSQQFLFVRSLELSIKKVIHFHTITWFVSKWRKRQSTEKKTGPKVIIKK